MGCVMEVEGERTKDTSSFGSTRIDSSLGILWPSPILSKIWTRSSGGRIGCTLFSTVANRCNDRHPSQNSGPRADFHPEAARFNELILALEDSQVPPASGKLRYLPRDI